MPDSDQTSPLTQLERLYSDAPIGLCYLDADLRFVHINEWLASINGLPVAEHIGRKIAAVLPDVAARIESQLRGVIETGMPLVQGRVDAETPARPGEVRHYLHNYEPDKNEDGAVVGIRIAVQDITIRVRAEEALRRSRDELEERVKERTVELTASEARLRLMADSLPVLISYVDLDQRFRFNNIRYEEWFGRPREEIEGEHIRDLLGSAAYQAIRPYVEGALADRPQAFEQEVPFTHGGTRHVRANYIPDHDPDGKVVGFYALVVDVSESKRADAEHRQVVAESFRLEGQQLLLKQRERIMREMHDGLGGQLVSLLSMVQRGHATVDEVTDALRRALDDMRIMIDTLETTEIGFQEQLGKLRARLEPLLRRNGLRLKWQIADLAVLDAFEPEQSLHALRIIQEAVTNVIQHAGATQVTIQVSIIDSDDETVEIEIRDNGIGPMTVTAPGGRGVRNMKARADELGAELRLESADPGRRVLLLIPVRMLGKTRPVVAAGRA